MHLKKYLGIAAVLITQGVVADDDDYLHCMAVDEDNDVVYFSGVFLGDYSRSTKYENRFYDYVEGRIGADVSAFRTSCFYEDDRREAESELNEFAADKRRSGYRVQFTSWTY